jgi:Golgi phosphoprotein 3 (GPP34)
MLFAFMDLPVEALLMQGMPRNGTHTGTELGGTGRLADDLYLLAHHEMTGRPRLQSRAAGLGLAGGLLAELMLSGSIGLRTGSVVVAGRCPLEDGLARSVMRLVAGERGQHGPGDWLAFLSRTAADDVAFRLEQAGYLARVVPRRPSRARRWVPVDPESAFAPVLGVKLALDPSRPAAAQNITLAGLAAACGLSRQLALYLPDGAHRRIQQATGRLQPGLRELIAHTQAAVDSALLSHRV